MDVRVAIVTGGTGGLGAAIVDRFLADGLRVAVADRVGPERRDALALEVDVTDPRLRWSGWPRRSPSGSGGSTCSSTTQASPARPRPSSITRPTSGGGCSRSTSTGCSTARVRAAHARARRRARRQRRFDRRQGGQPEHGRLLAAKAGVIAFTKSVAKELATTGVLVNCVVPAVIDAGLTHEATEEERALFASRVPMGRMGTSAELAALVAWWRPPSARSRPSHVRPERRPRRLLEA